MINLLRNPFKLLRWNSSRGLLRRGPLVVFNSTQLGKKLVRCFHRHTAKVGNEMSAGGMTCQVTFGALSSILASKGKHISTMAAPISTNIGNRGESMRNAMVDLDFITILV